MLGDVTVRLATNLAAIDEGLMAFGNLAIWIAVVWESVAMHGFPVFTSRGGKFFLYAALTMGALSMAAQATHWSVTHGH